MPRGHTGSRCACGRRCAPLQHPRAPCGFRIKVWVGCREGSPRACMWNSSACTSVPEIAAATLTYQTRKEMRLAIYEFTLWVQAREMGVHAAHSMAGVSGETGSDFALELFAHCTRFAGKRVCAFSYLLKGRTACLHPHVSHTCWRLSRGACREGSTPCSATGGPAGSLQRTEAGARA